MLDLQPPRAPVTPPRRSFTPAQRRILAVLAGVVGLRMLGLALVLPVMTLYALEFTSSRLLAGLAFGSYNSLQFLGSFAGGAIGGALAARSPAYMIGLLVVASLLGCRLLLRGPSP